MNLQSEISYVRSVVAEPYRATDSDSFILNTEIARWIYMSELATFDALSDLALASEVTDSSSMTLLTAEGISSSNDATVNWSRVVSVYGTKGGISMRGRMVDPEEFFSARRSKNMASPTQDTFFCTVDGKTLLVYSDPSVTPSSLIVRYLAKPTRRERFFSGTTTSSGSATHLFCTGAAGYDSGWFDDLFLEVRSGSASYVEREVSTFTTGTGRFDLATSAGSTIGTGVQFDVGQIPTLPEEYAPIWLAFACGLALTKKRPELAGGFFGQWETLVREVNSRYVIGTGMVSKAYQKIIGDGK